jgi:hypothetical protein
MHLTSDTGWEDAAEQLTTLPSDLQVEFGGVNFMRAGQYRKNGKRLFEEKIKPLLTSRKKLAVMVGYVDRALVDKVSGLTADHTKFTSATLQDIETGETLVVTLD